MKIFLDLQILDHIWRARNGQYARNYAHVLRQIEEAATSDRHSFFMSEISKVEMHHGFKNPNIDEARRQVVEKKDREKLELAEQMKIKWIMYPCSKYKDKYSLYEISLRYGGSFWNQANELELTLEALDGISIGDARQVVSMIYGSKEEGLNDVDVFVSKDRKLVNGLRDNANRKMLSILSGYRFLLPEELMNVW